MRNGVIRNATTTLSVVVALREALLLSPDDLLAVTRDEVVRFGLGLLSASPRPF